MQMLRIVVVKWKQVAKIKMSLCPLKGVAFHGDFADKVTLGSLLRSMFVPEANIILFLTQKETGICGYIKVLLFKILPGALRVTLWQTSNSTLNK